MAYFVILFIGAFSNVINSQNSSEVTTTSVYSNSTNIIKFGVICNFSGFGGLVTNAGALSLAVDKMKLDGYLKNYEFRYVTRPI